MIETYYKILEIEYTEDVKAVKKAYSKMIQKYHPEENPTEWQRIHNAYMIINNYLENKQHGISDSIPVQQTFNEVTNEVTNEEESKYDFGEAYEDMLKNNKDDLIKMTIPDEEQNQQSTVVKHEPGKFDNLYKKLNDKIYSEYYKDGRKLITEKSFYLIRKDTLYYEALLDALFVSKLADVLKKSAVDPNVKATICGDLRNLEQRMGSLPSNVPYERLKEVLNNSGKEKGKIQSQNQNTYDIKNDKSYSDNRSRKFSKASIIIIVTIIARLLAFFFGL